MEAAEIEELARSGQKIEAIKAYRERYGVGLKEAKDAIDHLEAGGSLTSPPRPTYSAGSSAQIEDLIRAGQKIEAIKVYRERHGGGLKEAKDAVDQIEANLAKAPSRRSEAPADLPSRIDDLIRSGSQVQAVKLYREGYGGDSKAAKEAVDRRAAEMGMATKSGCMVLPLGLLTLIGVVSALAMALR